MSIGFMENFISIQRTISKKIFNYYFIPLFLSGLFLIIILVYFFDFIETKKNLEILQNLKNKIHRENDSFKNLLIEWVDYEDPVKYFKNQYPDFVKKDIFPSVLNLKLNLFVSINTNNTIKEIYFFDEKGNFSPIPEEIYTFFMNQNISHLQNREDAYWGFLKTQNRLLVFAVSGVFWFQEQYRISHGTFVFGRIIDEKEIENYSNDINYYIELIPIQKNTNNPLEDLKILRKSVFTNEGYVLIKDFFDQPIFYFRVSFPKEITKLGFITIVFLIALNGTLGLVAYFLLIKNIRSLVIDRLQSFREEIEQIQTIEGKKQIQITNIQNKTDEITILQKSFNELLLKIEQQQNAKESYIQLLTMEKEKTYNLLLNILPKNIAEKLTFEPDSFIAEEYLASVLFADIVNFTSWSRHLDPKELVIILNQYFSEIDYLTEKYHIEKIKTIGDSYMAASGLPKKDDFHADKIILFSINILKSINDLNQKLNQNIQMRIGIHSGRVVGGVIGIKKFTFDIWGDTVNIASRMESTSQPNIIQISEKTYESIQDESLKKQFSKTGKLKLKSNDIITIYRLTNTDYFFNS